MFHFSREQHYQIILLIFILSLAGGSIFFDFKVFGIQFYAYRAVVLVGLVYFSVKRQLVFYTSTYEKYVFWFLSFWLIYAVGSLYWCPDMERGLKEVVYLFLGVSGYLLLISLRSKISDFEKRFAESWMLVFFCVAVFSINEIITQSHFLSSFTEEIVKYGEAHKINRVPVFGFDNPNHYAVYLCVTIVLSIYLLFRKIHVKLTAMALVLALFILYFMDSRLSQLFLGISLIVLAGSNYSSVKKWKYFHYLKWVGLSLGALVLILAVLVLKKNEEKEQTMKPAMYSILTDVTELTHGVPNDSSDFMNDVRLNIDYELKKRLVMNRETISARYINLNRYQANKNLLSGIKPGIKKMLFPLSFVTLCFVGVLIFRRNRSVYSGLLLFQVLLVVIWIGMFATHPFLRMNEKWDGYVIVETLNAQNTASLVTQLTNCERKIEPVSLKTRTAEKFRSGQDVTLKWMSQPVDPGASCSDAVRKKLILNGLDYLKRSRFMGVGAAGYASLSDKGKALYHTGTINTPHCLLIEILSQYGMVIALAFILLLIYPLFFLMKELKRRHWSKDHLILLLVLICLGIMGNSNSSSLSLPIIWVNFTLVMVFFNNVIKANKPEHDSSN